MKVRQNVQIFKEIHIKLAQMTLNLKLIHFDFLFHDSSFLITLDGNLLPRVNCELTCSWPVHVEGAEEKMICCQSWIMTLYFFLKSSSLCLCSWPWCTQWDRASLKTASLSLYGHSWSACFRLLTSTPAGLWTPWPPSMSHWTENCFLLSGSKCQILAISFLF